MSLPVELREEFPFICNSGFIYFDNAATTQKPHCVINKITKLYSECNANIHRGAHRLSLLMTEKYEQARAIAADFIGAQSEEIIFTHGTTDSINLLARAIENYIEPGDNIAVTVMEHNSNLLPWQQLCKRKNAVLTLLPVSEAGTVSAETAETLLNRKTKLLAIADIYNTTGCKNNISEIVRIAKQKGIKVFTDAAQSAAHCRIDVKEYGCDFLAFSGHKIYGPTGVGVLYCKKESRDILEIPRFGGGMVSSVGQNGFTPADMPYCFEAGTPDYIGAIALAEAIGFLKRLGMENVESHSKELSSYFADGIKCHLSDTFTVFVPDTALYGIISFKHNDMHCFDTAKYLDCNRIAVRSGNHCCHIGMNALQTDGTVRASFGLYNTKEEIDILLECLSKLRR